MVVVFVQRDRFGSSQIDRSKELDVIQLLSQFGKVTRRNSCSSRPQQVVNDIGQCAITVREAVKPYDLDLLA